ncbi:AAA family ATPase [Pseudoflavonifractor phocaeensis]|uniref:AAA family ATPase n=1 Tax=Pseudoflavonifractor phocaeensis TaxID=1870988 RepID=UPI00195D2360|nr:AAA family ATPase [Pseudoflavonifractor phocaeensis]MBM6724241.1 AAA family ATPase [Pseudoflavonifractor phocaeensis]
MKKKINENGGLTLSKAFTNLTHNDPNSATWVLSILVGLITGPILFGVLCLLTLDQCSGPRGSEHLTMLGVVSGLIAFMAGPLMANASRAKVYMDEVRPQKRPAVTQRPVQRPTQEKPVQQPKPSKPEKKEAPKNTPAEQTEVTISTAPTGVEATTFDDIAGYKETKKNMAFVVKCLRDPAKLRAVGAKVPRGILLYGPPGTGKTLMAKAIAGTAGVKFYSANATEFVNIWVGQGAQNVRALYQEAKQNAPSIVFIDEIDAIGGTRTAGQNQEYRQTLNALLTEMDGMDKDSGVLTIAATNAFEELDPALIRPGRFDRKIAIPLPNMSDRAAIIRLYASKRRLASDINLENLARETVGMSGSAIATLFNEASIRAVMDNRTIVTRADMDAAMTQMLTNGEVQKGAKKEELLITAYHEAGHAILSILVAKDPIQKVTIIGNTAGAMGLTVRGGDDRSILPVEVLRARAIMSYGGRAAEELVFGKENITTGASQDLKDASYYIRAYLDAGAGESLLNAESFVGQKIVRDTSEAKKLSVDLYNEALEFLSQHRDLLDRVANALLAKETLMSEDLDALIQG